MKRFSSIPSNEDDLKHDILQKGDGDFAKYVQSYGGAYMLLKKPSEIEVKDKVLGDEEGNQIPRRLYEKTCAKNKKDRTGNSLAMSRALGDFIYKNNKSFPPSEQLLIPNPKLIVTERSKEDKYLFLASDGIYDVLENDQIASFLAHLDEDMYTGFSSNLPSYCDEVISKAMIEGTRDNLSTVLVNLDKPIMSRKLKF